MGIMESQQRLHDRGTVGCVLHEECSCCVEVMGRCDLHANELGSSKGCSSLDFKDLVKKHYAEISRQLTAWKITSCGNMPCACFYDECKPMIHPAFTSTYVGGSYSS